MVNIETFKECFAVEYRKSSSVFIGNAVILEK